MLLPGENNISRFLSQIFIEPAISIGAYMSYLLDVQNVIKYAVRNKENCQESQEILRKIYRDHGVKKITSCC